MNGTVATRIGNLNFESGFPSDKSVTKLFDEMDFQRATQAYLWALPIVAFAEWQHSHREVAGAREIDYVGYLSGREKLGILTPNATTPYYLNFADLSKTGPLVVEEPEGLTAGGILDMWQRPAVDTGQIGPFAGKGGRYLVLGPGQPDMQVEGYATVRVGTNNTFIAFRVLDPREDAAARIVSELKIYPYEDRDNPPQTRIVPAAGLSWIAGAPEGIAYWERLADILNREPVDDRDKMMTAMLRALGIVHGQPFRPDSRQKQILEQAALVGLAMARANGYAKRLEGSRVWPDRRWEMSLLIDETDQDTPTHTQLDERASWFYEAVGVSEGMMCRTVGAGQCYLEAQKDSDGRWLDGGQSYRLRVPANAPVVQFWSFSVYDVETRSLIDTGTRSDVSSRMDLAVNDDGSVDLYFGPEAPAGLENNWVKTIPGRGWFTYFRLYGPAQEFFDRAWKLNDIERSRK
ncbi:MAG: DUF1254 domain-containing protein [Chromatiales bacterium]|nr:MAG: DUF1254 domain-containing protein [Chromatiales bacterium]